MLECSPLGLGKGVLGVVARPVGGIVDLASSSFDGIQRWSCIQSYRLCEIFILLLILIQYIMIVKKVNFVYHALPTGSFAPFFI